MKKIKFDNDPVINKDITDTANKIVAEHGIDYAIKKAEDMLVDSEYRLNDLLSKNKPLYKSKEHVTFSKKLIEYFYNMKAEIRNKKLKSLLGEKKILNFNNFTKI